MQHIRVCVKSSINSRKRNIAKKEEGYIRGNAASKNQIKPEAEGDLISIIMRKKFQHLPSSACLANKYAGLVKACFTLNFLHCLKWFLGNYSSTSPSHENYHVFFFSSTSNSPILFSLYFFVVFFF